MTIKALPILTTTTNRLLDGCPVATIGAGPVGLAAAAHLLKSGIKMMPGSGVGSTDIGGSTSCCS